MTLIPDTIPAGIVLAFMAAFVWAIGSTARDIVQQRTQQARWRAAMRALARATRPPERHR